MKSTKQVRAWFRAHVSAVPCITTYTNKVKNPNIRHVKVYLDELTDSQFASLRVFAGAANVKVTTPTRGYPDLWGSRAGVIVRCDFE